MNERNARNILFISLSQFGMAFSFNFLMVFIPFYIHKISPYSPGETLVWVGLIMGSASLMAAVASTFWGSLASRYLPKKIYMRGLLSHSVLILLMAFVTNLPLLLAIRIVQGTLGGISTVGLIIVSSSSSRESATADMGFFQNCITMGQLLGPPVGAFAASLLGYKGTFISASALVFVTLLFCFLFVVDVPQKSGPKEGQAKRALNGKIFFAWGVCFAATVQLMFLPGVLPNIFESFGVEHDVALRWSGLFVMSYTATAMIGTYLLCRLAPKTGIVKVITCAGALGIILQSLLAVSPGIAAFVAIRMIQTALIAAVLPLMISFFASDLSGKVIGFLNSGRFAGNAMGPIIGTSVLALSSLNSVFLFISALGIVALAGFGFSFRKKDNL
ncbi:MAG: MFS transporter [Desulfobacteraceae bacterium]|nr:MAG: MFS transporter [Desulfobacteraceae bacterium]